jgi:hypothetical protein
MKPQNKKIIVQTLLSLVYGGFLGLIALSFFSLFTGQTDFIITQSKPLTHNLSPLNYFLFVVVTEVGSFLYMRRKFKQLTSYALTEDATIVIVGADIAAWLLATGLLGILLLSGADMDKLKPLPFLMIVTIVWAERAYLWCYAYAKGVEEG